MEKNKNEMDKILKTVSKSESMTSISRKLILFVESRHTVPLLGLYAADVDVSERRRRIRLVDLLEQRRLLQPRESDVLEMGQEIGIGRQSVLKIGA